MTGDFKTVATEAELVDLCMEIQKPFEGLGSLLVTVALGTVLERAMAQAREDTGCFPGNGQELLRQLQMFLDQSTSFVVVDLPAAKDTRH